MSELAPVLAQRLDALLEEKREEAAQNITEFPVDITGRTQDIIIRLMLRGLSFEDIAAVVGSTAVKVKLLAKSAWAERALQEAVEGDSSDKPIEALMRLQTFNAIMKCGELIDNPHGPTALGACALVMKYTLKPMTEQNVLKGKGSGNIGKMEDVQKEFQELERERVRLAKEAS